MDVESSPSERTGIWSPLKSPIVYEAFQHLVGARRWLKRFARDTIRVRPGERVLDIGCGPGTLRRYLAETQYIGFDRNPAYIAQAQAEYGARGQFICDDVANFASHGFAPVDVAVAIGLLHHLDDGLAGRLLQAVQAALKPGGRLITADPCLYPGQSPIIRAVILLDRGTHVRSPDQYRQLCEAVLPGARTRIEAAHLPFPHAVCAVESSRS